MEEVYPSVERSGLTGLLVYNRIACQTLAGNLDTHRRNGVKL